MATVLSPGRPGAALRFPPREVASFAAIGIVCTLLFALAYDASRAWFPPLAANCLALTSTAGLNFAANRWLTFRGRGGGLARDGWQYALCYVIGLAASSLALAVFLALWAEPPHGAEIAAALAASGVATAIRYVALTLWVFPTDQRVGHSGHERTIPSSEVLHAR